MQVFDLAFVRRHFVQMNESSRWLWAVVTFSYNNALIDVGVLAHIDVAGVMAGNYRMNVESLGEDTALLQSRR